MSIFVQSVSTSVAAAVKAAGIWVAWGRGDGAWDTVPEAEPVDAAALVDEVGRRRAQVIEYVVPDVDGDIIVPQGTFAISPTPTSTLYVRCTFSNTDAVDEDIREAAAFIGTQLIGGLPVGQDYFEPDDINDEGIMMMLHRFGKIERSADFNAAVQFIMTL